MEGYGQAGRMNACIKLQSLTQEKTKKTLNDIEVGGI
jgi:hypothetical protein